MWETQFDPWVGKIPWRRQWQPTPVLLPGKSHGRRSLVGCSPWGCYKLDTTSLSLSLLVVTYFASQGQLLSVLDLSHAPFVPTRNRLWVWLPFHALPRAFSSVWILASTSCSSILLVVYVSSDPVGDTVTDLSLSVKNHFIFQDPTFLLVKGECFVLLKAFTDIWIPPSLCYLCGTSIFLCYLKIFVIALLRCN